MVSDACDRALPKRLASAGGESVSTGAQHRASGRGGHRIFFHLAIDVLNVEFAKKLAERYRRIGAPNTSDELHHRSGLLLHLRRDNCERSAASKLRLD